MGDDRLLFLYLQSRDKDDKQTRLWGLSANLLQGSKNQNQSSASGNKRWCNDQLDGDDEMEGRETEGIVIDWECWDYKITPALAFRLLPSLPTNSG